VSRFLFGRYVESDLRGIRDHVRKDSPDAARRLMIRFVLPFASWHGVLSSAMHATIYR
jgi:hypothetical protein